jgi:hypothetical protein
MSNHFHPQRINAIKNRSKPAASEYLSSIINNLLKIPHYNCLQNDIIQAKGYFNLLIPRIKQRPALEGDLYCLIIRVNHNIKGRRW